MSVQFTGAFFNKIELILHLSGQRVCLLEFSRSNSNRPFYECANDSRKILASDRHICAILIRIFRRNLKLTKFVFRMMKGKAGKVIRQLTRSNTNVAASVASKVHMIAFSQFYD